MTKLSKNWKEQRITFKPTIRQIFVIQKAYEKLKGKFKEEFLDKRGIGKYISKQLDEYINPKQWKELNQEWKELREKQIVKVIEKKSPETKLTDAPRHIETRVWRADD